jgi:hypothetical protein
MTNLNETATEEQLKLLNDLFGLTPEKIEANNRAMEERRRNQVVMKIKTKYVITETKSLISPMGYSPELPVYEQTQVAIQTNDLASFKVPNGTTLYAHNVEKIVADYLEVLES